MRRCARHAARALRCDERGATILEFALVTPVFLTLILGIFDLGQMVYAQALLNGAVQQAARSSTLETANTAAADQLVEDLVGPVVPGATFTSKRVSYYDFVDIGRAEKWNDTDGNGDCDNNENYTDENGNGQWDEDVGESGNGSANDTVVYTVTVQFEPMIPIPFMPKKWGETTLTSTAVKKNQPFATQADYGSTAGVCA